MIKKQRRLAAALADAAGLRAAVEQQAEAFRRGLSCQCCGVISSPAGVSQVESLIPSSSFQVAGQEPALAQHRIAAAQLVRRCDESGQRFAASHRCAQSTQEISLSWQ